MPGEKEPDARQGAAPEQPQLEHVAPDVGHDPAQAGVHQGEEADGHDGEIEPPAQRGGHHDGGRVERHPERQSP